MTGRPMAAGGARIRDWMTADPVTVGPGTPIAEVRRLLDERRLHHLPVVEDGRLCGIVSDRDVGLSARSVRRAARAGALDALLDDDRPVSAIMTRRTHTVPADAPLEVAVRQLLSRRVHGLPVLDADGCPVGIVTAVDCLLALMAAGVDDGGA